MSARCCSARQQVWRAACQWFRSHNSFDYLNYLMRLITSARKLYHDNNFDEQEGRCHIYKLTGTIRWTTSHFYSWRLIWCGKVLPLLVDKIRKKWPAYCFMIFVLFVMHIGLSRWCIRLTAHEERSCLLVSVILIIVVIKENKVIAFETQLQYSKK